MPRRNRRTQTWRPQAYEPQHTRPSTPEAMAEDLVRRGLAPVNVLESTRSLHRARTGRREDEQP